MAVKKTGRMVFCPICNVEKPSNEFYESENPHDGCVKNKNGNIINMGYVHICKNDIAKCYLEYLKKGTIQSAVYFTCALTDTPFIKEVWDRYIKLRNEKIKDGKINPIQLKTYNDFAKYREQLKSMKKATDNWNDFSATNIDYTTIMGLKKPDIALEAEKDTLILNWGIQDQMSDYDFLNMKFDKYTNGVEFINPQQEDLYRDLCRDRLIERKINEKRYDGKDDLNSVQTRIGKLMSTLKVDEFESTKPKTMSEQSLFEKIRLIDENNVQDVYKEPTKYFDHNKIHKYEEDMCLRPLGNMLVGHRDFNINIDDIERYNLD